MPRAHQKENLHFREVVPDVVPHFVLAVFDYVALGHAYAELVSPIVDQTAPPPTELSLFPRQGISR